jgi:hypothetical protein
MKKVLILIVIILLGAGGYFVYQNISDKNLYTKTLDSRLSSPDWHWKNNINQPIAEKAQAYSRYDYSFSVDIATFENENEARKAEEDWIIDHNPAKIGINGKYVSYLQESNQYIYTIGEHLISVQSGNADNSTTGSFVSWYDKHFKSLFKSDI